MNLLEELKNRLDNQDLWEGEVKLSRGDYIVKSGQKNTKVYLVEEGSLRIFLLDDREELTIRFGYQGDVITALDSYITGEASEYYIQALKKCRVKIMSKEKFEEFIFSDSENTKIWISLMQGLVYSQMQREQDILISSPLERYKRVLARSPRLFQEIPHKYIASYLRMTPETLSRIIRKS